MAEAIKQKITDIETEVRLVMSTGRLHFLHMSARMS